MWCVCTLTMVLNKANTPQQKSQNKNKERCLPLNASPCIEKNKRGSQIYHVTQSLSVTILVYAMVTSKRAPKLFEWHSRHSWCDMSPSSPSMLKVMNYPGMIKVTNYPVGHLTINHQPLCYPCGNTLSVRHSWESQMHRLAGEMCEVGLYMYRCWFLYSAPVLEAYMYTVYM